MSFDPGSIISLIQNCKTLYDYYADVKHSSKDRRRLLDEVQSLQSQLEALQKLAETPGISGDKASMGQLAKMLDSSEPFAKVVNETFGRVKDVLTYGTSDPKANRFKVLGKRGAAALWWTIDKAEVKDLFSDLERYKTRIGLALQHDTFDHIITEYRLKVARFISEVDFTGHQSSLIQQRLNNTGTWLIQDTKFVAWRDSTDSSRTLWCYGHPGAGKSVMAASIVDHLQSKGADVLSVFCRYSSDAFTTPYPVLCGLLRQLIENSPIVLPAIDVLYRSHKRPNPDKVQIFLAEIASSHARPIYIIIDALDECKIALDLLRAVQQLGPSFRVLITSRPIFDEIKKYPSIKIRASDHDILVAVDTTLPKLKGAWLDDALKSTIRAKIVEKADGMFLLASLQLRELEHDITRPRDVIAILDSLPRTLDDAYQLTFQRIREQGERKNELVCHALALIMLDSVSVSVDWQVQRLLAEGDTAQYSDIETILQCCHGLIGRYRSHLAFIHYSAHEYTTAHWSDLFPEHSNRSNVCIQLGFSTLIQSTYFEDHAENILAWGLIVETMKEPDELKQATSHLSTAAARTWFVGLVPKFPALRDDPLLIACYCYNLNVVEYMIKNAPPDALRFNEVLSFCKKKAQLMVGKCLDWIIARPDMRLNRKGLLVALDPDGCEANSSDEEDDEYVSPSLRRYRALDGGSWWW